MGIFIQLDDNDLDLSELVLLEHRDSMACKCCSYCCESVPCEAALMGGECHKECKCGGDLSPLDPDMAERIEFIQITEEFA